MVYFDTNIYLYAFLQDVDNLDQQSISIELIKKSLDEKEEIIISEVLLCEYAFVSKKLKANNFETNESLNFLSSFIEPSPMIHKRVMAIMESCDFYKNSFDAYHLAFAEHYECEKLITFDKDYKKLRDIAKIDIVII
jgi:predicted nucleic acid-binding protein